MGCFIVPAAEAVITTIATKILKSKEKTTVQVQLDSSDLETAEKIPFSRKMKWLNNMLWGGSALLAFEHLWHGEITPFFSFLTAAANPADLHDMLIETAAVGTGMAVLVTGAWAGMVFVTDRILKRRSEAERSEGTAK